MPNNSLGDSGCVLGRDMDDIKNTCRESSLAEDVCDDEVQARAVLAGLNASQVSTDHMETLDTHLEEDSVTSHLRA